MNFISLIETKRDGGTLKSDQIAWLITEYCAGNIPDYQMSAFLMAVYLRGMDAAETRSLTLAMRDSGDTLHFPADGRPLVDKHSTGGVGDKVSLPLAPLLAALGFRVPMISGRGLGITGGTLDKMDSIPGFQTSLPREQIIEQVQSLGCMLCGQTPSLVPADKKIYALRDVTATVPSLPLIVSSILSKKLAEGLGALVLDVKFGAGAFMRDRASAQELADAMVRLGQDCGVRTQAVLSPMDHPLGRSAGNWLEVKESVHCLENRPGLSDLRELVLTCAAELLRLTGRASDLPSGRAQAQACLETGEPLRKWEALLAAQGADLVAYRHKLARDTTAPVVLEVHSPASGIIQDCNARIIGEVVRDLGGGRLTKESVLNYEVGLDCLAKPGEAIYTSGLLARIHAASRAAAEAARARVQEAFTIT